MVTVISILIIIVFLLLVIRGYLKKISRGCCGSGDEGTVKKKKVEDKNKSHYPYLVDLTVDGIVCENCSRRIENSLNSLEGIWATAENNRHILVRMKYPVDNKELRQAVAAAGPYTVLQITHQNS